jgi:hypothetical protein
MSSESLSLEIHHIDVSECKETKGKIVIMKGSIFWDIMLYLLKVNQHSGGTCHLHLQGQRISQARNGSINFYIVDDTTLEVSYKSINVFNSYEEEQTNRQHHTISLHFIIDQKL